MRVLMTAEQRAYQEAAFRLHNQDGELEIDLTDELPGHMISEGNDGSGAYVLAWVWVSKADARKYRGRHEA